MKSPLRRLADNTNADSLATNLPRRRFGAFLQMADNLAKSAGRPLNILDVGGTESFWVAMGATSLPHHVTLLNLDEVPTRYPNITSFAGDARDMAEFRDRQFDIVLSNSVIEHVGTFADQAKMAKEVQRVADHCFVQTPSFFFPLEPHFLFPFFQWFPVRLRVWLLMNFSLGWFERQSSREEALRIVSGIRLMKASELKALFPGARINRERVLGLTKSYIVSKWDGGGFQGVRNAYPVIAEYSLLHLGQ